MKYANCMKNNHQLLTVIIINCNNYHLYGGNIHLTRLSHCYMQIGQENCISDLEMFTE